MRKKTYTIAIIGGTGRFGRFWKKYFESKGCEVFITGRRTVPSSQEAVRLADIIIISVSIRNTAGVIDELIPFIPEGKLLMDFTGIKSEAIAHMLRYKGGEVVGTHPMFGPNVLGIAKQNIAYDPVRGGEKWEYVLSLWKEDGANLIEMSSKRHDEIIGIIQPATHFLNFIFGFILKQGGIHPEELVALSTPNSRMQTYIFSRFLWQQADLYADMQICNPIFRQTILKEINRKVRKLTEIVETNDFDAFETEFNGLKDFIGTPFLEKAMQASSEIDQSLKVM